ncbi:MAG: hypothetical protein QM499_11790 [Flavobacteriaceae bacterium]
MKNKKFNFLKPTLIFLIVGLFIPGFTVIALLGFQMLLTSLGIECHNAWNILWTVTVLGGLILPILFYIHIQYLTEKKLKNLKLRLTLFNLFEYIFIQASLALFFTNGQTLCYVSDGQNGMELVFTAWLALPILIGFSFLFQQTLRKNE